MSDLAEVKSIFDKGMETVEALRAKVEEVEKKGADAVSTDEVKKIEADFAAKFTAMNDASKALAARLEEAETKLNRPGGAKDKANEPEMKGFLDFVRDRKSDDRAAFETKAMTEDSNPGGGYLVPVTMRDGIISRLRRTSPVRAVANVQSIAGNRWEEMLERDDTGFEWVGETQTRAETGTPTVNMIAIDAHELSAMPKISQRMLDDATFDLGAWLEGRISDRFARAEASAYVTGNGVNKPRGFLTYDTAATADDARAAKTIQRVNTGSSGAFAGSGAGADVLIDAVYALQSGYRAGARWMAKNTTAAALAKLKDGDGNYLLQSMMGGNGQVVNRLHGYPLDEADDMPAIGAGTLSLAFASWMDAYTIVDAGGVRILRDPFSAKPFILFYSTKRTGGGVSNFDAIKLVQFS